MGRLRMIEAEETVACNLIPMIDIMFLLLLFFMLSADMVTKEMESVVLPGPLDKATQDDDKNKKDYDTEFIAIVHEKDIQDRTDCADYNTTGCKNENHWLVKLAGATLNDLPNRTDWAPVKARLREIATIPGEMEAPDPTSGATYSKRAIVLRCDHKAPYGVVQRLIQTLNQPDPNNVKIGFYKIEPGAGVPAPPKPGSAQ
jgi:biopolymer transport protein ExbD